MARPILELGDLVPETTPIRLNRITGSTEGPDSSVTYKTEMVTLQAFMYGPRCPVVVKAALRQVLERMNKEVTEDGYSDEKFQQYARDSFMQLIPGLSFEEADLLASDDDEKEGRCIKTLKYLNYWREASTPQDIQVNSTTEGEVIAEAEKNQTTPESSPTSA